MRHEDKAVEGPELQLEEERDELEQDDQEEVPEVDIARVLESERENVVLQAMREILEHRHIVINDLKLPQRELRALEALKAAVSGRDGNLAQFVYASDRRDLLEQALAVLQPGVMAAVKPFADLVQRVGNLRHDLKDLEDAQDNLLEANVEVGVQKADTDTADKPKPKPDDTSLDGPPRSIEKPPTSLDGPALKPEPELPSTLDGPALKPEAKPPTSLTGERAPEKKLPSALDGPALPAEPPHETTVGSRKDLAEADIPEPQRLKTIPFWRDRDG